MKMINSGVRNIYSVFQIVCANIPIIGTAVKLFGVGVRVIYSVVQIIHTVVSNIGAVVKKFGAVVCRNRVQSMT